MLGVLPDLDRIRSAFPQVFGEPYKCRKGDLDREPGADVAVPARAVAVGNRHGHGAGNHLPSRLVLTGLPGSEVVCTDDALGDNRGPLPRAPSRPAATRRHWRLMDPTVEAKAAAR